MSRGNIVRQCRGLTVWLAVTVLVLGAAALASTSWQAARPRVRGVQFVDLLVALCAAMLLLALVWLWAVTTVTVLELLSGRTRTSGGTTRRLVLLACGAAVLAGASTPAMASGGDGAAVLAGLRLPDRSVATAEPHRRSAAATTAEPRSPVHVVQIGESLWSIARSLRTGGDVDELWREIWAVNRDVIGADPDLILPGQELRLPSTSDPDPDPDPEQGAR